MAYGIGNGYSSALRDSDQSKAVHTRGIHHGLKVLDPKLEGHLLHVPLGEAVATFVVADQSMVSGHFDEPMSPERAVPFIVKMIEPIGGLDERISGASASVGQTDAIPGDTKLDLLPRCGQGQVA